ncbi:MAG: TrkH family potassium uptake protein [Pyramidobacter sp.]|jgi:trk system potassium uptake protein TrkH|nr:TrkH family potassium uptake protein [Pyramidobacter sp.]
MNRRIVFLLLALIGAIVAGTMFAASLIAAVCHWPDVQQLLKWSLGALGVCGAIAMAAFKKRRKNDPPEHITGREAFVIVSLSWVIASVIGALPYTDCGLTFTDAFFEAMSGFSTTGASILTNVEGLSRGVLLWRSLTHWLGGMGIIVLCLAIIPFIGGSGIELFKAESPTPIPEKLTPRLSQTALYLWLVYILLTVLETIALKLCGMSFYDAVNHAFATMATGGFSTRNASIAAFGSPAVEWVITVFMFLAGVNFTLHFLFLRGSFGAYFADDEFRWYAGITLIVTALIAVCAAGAGMAQPLSQTIRHAAFQTVTILTTTGFGVTDTLQWPYFVHLILLLLMFIGGCAGSTGGGMKVLRVMVLTRSVKNDMLRTLQPKRVLCVRIGGKPQENDLVRSILAFFVMFMILLGVMSLALTWLGIDVLSSLSGVLACLSNIGPGLGQFGPVSNYAAVPTCGKWILSFAMLVGRLEITTVMMLFMPSTWRR